MELQNKNMRQNTAIESLSISFNENKIFIKRDDLFAFSFGGNKARKAKKYFEFLNIKYVIERIL